MAQTAQEQRPVSPALVNGWMCSPESYHTIVPGMLEEQRASRAATGRFDCSLLAFLTGICNTSPGHAGETRCPHLGEVSMGRSLCTYPAHGLLHQ
jgi:hypothetical protein